MASRRIVGTLCRFTAQRSGARRRFAGLCSARTDPRANTVPHRNRLAEDLVTSPLPKYVTAEQGHRGYSTSHYDKWTELSFEDLVALIDSGDIQLIDVREPKEIEDSGAIPRSVNIPLGELVSALDLSEDAFLSKYAVKKPNEDDDNIVYSCLHGIRAHRAMIISHTLGYHKARHYPGGFDEWITKQRLQH